MCFFYGKSLRLHWEGKASLSQPDISLIQGWPGLPFTWPCPQKFIIQEEGVHAAGKQRRGCVLFESDRTAFPFEPCMKTKCHGSAARQLADGEVRRIRPVWAFSSWPLFFLVCFSPLAACHCVLVIHTHIQNTITYSTVHWTCTNPYFRHVLHHFVCGLLCSGKRVRSAHVLGV